MGTNEMDHPGSGYCANSVFIIDKFDMVLDTTPGSMPDVSKTLMNWQGLSML